YSLSTDLERPWLLKLDGGLNQIKGKELPGVPVFSFNELCPLAGSSYAFWITSTDKGSQPGTKVMLYDTVELVVVEAQFIGKMYAKKVVKIDDASYYILTRDSQLIHVSLVNNAISFKQGFYTNDVVINDVLPTTDGLILITGTLSGTSHFVGVFNHPVIELFINSNFREAPWFSHETEDGRIMVHDSRHVLVLDISVVGGVINLALLNARLLITPQSLPGPAIKIYQLTNDPVSKEMFMLAGENGYYKGEIAAVFGENLQTCILVNGDFSSNFQKKLVKLQKDTYAGSPVLVSKQNLNNVVSDSRIIDVSDVMCEPVEQPGTTLRCITALQQVCWLTLEQFEYNETIPGQEAVEQDQEDMVAAIQKTAQPIWRPNTKYYIRFRLKDDVDNGGSTSRAYDYYYGFRTVGPLGHYHKHPDAHYLPAGASPDEYPLTSLSQYIDYNRSYPNADGNLLQAKPIFYGNQQCKITIFFAQPLAYHMLTTWPQYNGLPELKGEMHIAIKDPVTDTVIPYPLPVNWTDETVPLPEAGEVWVDDDDPRIPLTIRMLNNYINYINEHDDAIECELTIGEPITPAAHAYSVTLTNLKPLKLYTAIVYNAFEVNSDNNMKSEEVHKFVFQTSRYANFEQQVKSYNLKDEDNNERQAVFSIPLTVTAAAINTAYNIITGASDPDSTALEPKYLHLFDRATEGVLGFKPLDAAVTTEFNLLKNVATGETIAILIRNPEPFNIPKIPLTEMQGAIEVMSGATPDNAYKVLYSKDYSQALIMHTSKKITAANLDFRFRYKTWNGSAYVPESTIDALQIMVNS
ncbi:MAG: hypothetical protein WCF67_01690, partial [Chitinophagaceae bacterium]